MIIRTAKQTDAKTIKYFFDELRKYELGLFDGEIRYMQENWEEKRSIVSIRKLLRTKGRFLVAEEGKVIGFANGYVVIGAKYKEGYIDTLYVSRPFRGGGVGKALTTELIKWFKKQGCKTVSLNTYLANKKANTFYRKLKFRPIGIRYRKRI
ncbi:MAG: GNAT family N-acetyltransferase [Candidatus Aenigmarchaeota archaeon]|nr:GNAT family N-acetyltransferase [Candidatus Aenigmarchaeota archaeon]